MGRSPTKPPARATIRCPLCCPVATNHQLENCFVTPIGDCKLSVNGRHAGSPKCDDTLANGTGTTVSNTFHTRTPKSGSFGIVMISLPTGIQYTRGVADKASVL